MVDSEGLCTIMLSMPGRAGVYSVVLFWGGQSYSKDVLLSHPCHSFWLRKKPPMVVVVVQGALPHPFRIYFITALVLIGPLFARAFLRGCQV